MTTALIAWLWFWGGVEIVAESYTVPPRHSLTIRLIAAILWPVAIPAAWVSARFKE